MFLTITFQSATLAPKSSSDMEIIESTEFIIRHKNYLNNALGPRIYGTGPFNFTPFYRVNFLSRKTIYRVEILDFGNI